MKKHSINYYHCKLQINSNCAKKVLHHVRHGSSLDQYVLWAFEAQKELSTLAQKEFILFSFSLSLPPPGEEMVGSEVLEESGEKISKKEASSLSLEEDESFSSNYGDVTTNELQSAVEGKELTDVSNLVEEIVGSEVSIRGRVHKNRLVGTKLFVILRESGFTVQCVVEETRVGANMIKFVKQLSRESVVELIGVVSHPKKPLTGTTQQVDCFL